MALRFFYVQPSRDLSYLSMYPSRFLARRCHCCRLPGDQAASTSGVAGATAATTSAATSAVTSADNTPPPPPSISSLILQDIVLPSPPTSPVRIASTSSAASPVRVATTSSASNDLTVPEAKASKRRRSDGRKVALPKTVQSPSKVIPIDNDDVTRRGADEHDSDSSVSPVIRRPPSIADQLLSTATPFAQAVTSHGDSAPLLTMTTHAHAQPTFEPLRRGRVHSEPGDRRRSGAGGGGGARRHHADAAASGDGGAGDVTEDHDLQRAMELSRLGLAGGCQSACACSARLSDHGSSTVWSLDYGIITYNRPKSGRISQKSGGFFVEIIMQVK